MNERRGASGCLLMIAVVPWLLPLVLLQDNYQRYWPPGLDKRTLVHVVCPLADCDNQDWVTRYEPDTVTKCSRHRPKLPRIPMKRCERCEEQRGYHSPPVAG